jgi:hypothetical protein
VVPAEERFQSGDLSSGNIHLWLIHQKKFFFVECRSQGVLQGQSLHDLSIHIRRKKLKVLPSIVFGAIHGRIGILDQGFTVRTVFGENADAEAATNAKGVTLNYQSGSQCIHKPLSGNCCVGYVLYSSQHDEEFISAKSGYCVLFTRTPLKPFCNVLQKEVTDRMPERVIDDFEAVEIKEQKCNSVLLSTSSG